MVWSDEAEKARFEKMWQDGVKKADIAEAFGITVPAVRGRAKALRLTGNNEQRRVPVAQFDSQGRLVQVYQSVTAAARATGIGAGNIMSILDKRSRQAHGFRWLTAEGSLPKQIEPLAPRTNLPPKHPNARRAAVYDKSGTLLGEYSSLTAAGRAHGVVACTFYRCLENPSYTVNGLVARIVEGDDPAPERIKIPRHPSQVKWAASRRKRTIQKAKDKQARADRHVVQEVDENGRVIREFRNQSEAAKAIGVTRQMVSQGILMPCRVHGKILRLKHPKPERIKGAAVPENA